MDADTSAVTRTQHENGSLDGILYHHELTPVKGSVAKALQRMVAAGFSVQVVAGRLRVSPADRLTPVQRQWIAANKTALVAALAADSGHVAEIVKTFDATVMRVTPDPDPAAQQPVSVGLPDPTDTVVCYPVWEAPVMVGMVRCLDCQHGSRALPGDELAAWRLCEAGQGGHFALARHRCETFTAAL